MNKRFAGTLRQKVSTAVYCGRRIVFFRNECTLQAKACFCGGSFLEGSSPDAAALRH